MRNIAGMAVAAGMTVGLVCGLMIAAVALADPAQAQVRTELRRATQASEVSAQARPRRPATRLRIERYRRLPPTAVRSCNAWYEQERRPSGTVIVPRMACRWING